MTIPRRLTQHLLSAFALAALAACGGGGGGSETTSGGTGQVSSTSGGVGPAGPSTAPPPASVGSGGGTSSAGAGASPPAPAPAPAPAPSPSTEEPAAPAAPAPAAPAPAPVPTPVPAPVPAPSPAPAPTPGAVQISSSIDRVTPNTRYEVNGAGASLISIHLVENVTPMTGRFFAAGDFVSVRGLSANPWLVNPGFSPTVSARGRTVPRFISTVNLPGNAEPGQRWTARMGPRQWQSVAMEPEGSVLIAADAGGQLHLSTDAGNAWSASGPVANWSSVSLARMTWFNPSSAAGQVSIAAAARSGGVYAYEGGAWVLATPPELSALQWESVVVNEGAGMVGAVFNGPIYGSELQFAGRTWAPYTLQGSSTPLVRGWHALARTSSGIAAASEEGEVYVSGTQARTLVLRSVNVNGTVVTRPWHRIAASGNTLAVAGRGGSNLYISRDAGATWFQSTSPAGDYSGIAISADGQVIAATLSGGGVQLSRDGGNTFTALPLPGGTSAWQSIALSADANMLAVAAGGATAGQLYTSLGNRTAYASGGGAILGGQGDFIELEFMGNDRFGVRTSSGGPFTIR